MENKTYIMKRYVPLFEEFIQDDNSPEAKIRRYLANKRRKREKFEMNRPRPKTREELQDMIIEAIEKNGPEVDLNHIDVSEIDDMNHLFSTHYGGDKKKNGILRSFNGDISDWDVSNVTNMSHMFRYTGNFNGDISEWDVSSVTDMNSMFCRAKNFNGDISGWDVSSVTNMSFMFCSAKNFNKNISKWDVSSVEDISYMFCSAKNFDQDISKWDVSSVKDMSHMFDECPIEDKNKPKGLK